MKYFHFLVLVSYLFTLGCTEAHIDSATLSAPSVDPILVNSDETSVTDTTFTDTSLKQTSTFSIDVDTASYTIMRDHINRGVLPDKSVIRLEEYINYFNYSYKSTNEEHPFTVFSSLSDAPWASNHKLLKIALKAAEIQTEERSASNLIFLIDTSGSMNSEKKLPLLKQSLNMLVDQMTSNDSIGIVTYAGNSKVSLLPTHGDEKEKIKNAINLLSAAGSTNGEAGLATAYDYASFNYINDGINRVILATDGNFNVGQTDNEALVELIKTKAENNIYLTTLGFGLNYNDSLMENLADKGNGNYAYIDNLDESQKVLVSEINGTLITVANDVKLQLTFNNDIVKKYRLLGYENRRLKDEDFNDDTKDAGDMGAGHNVIALYEIELQDSVIANDDSTIANMEIRYKIPNESDSILFEFLVSNTETTDSDYNFAAAVAEYALILSNSPEIGSANLNQVIELAESNTGADLLGYRAEFISLVKKAHNILLE